MIWLVGIGGSLGAATRYLLGLYINKHNKKLTPFPLGTWIINISGSFILGLLANYYLKNQMANWIWYFFGVGFCGAYTTFSTFGYEIITLLQSKNLNLAILYGITSAIVGSIFAFIGLSF